MTPEDPPPPSPIPAIHPLRGWNLHGARSPELEECRLFNSLLGAQQALG